MLCYAMLCYAMLCYAALRCAALRSASAKRMRETCFPFVLVLMALELEIEHTEASVASDKRRLLNSLLASASMHTARAHMRHRQAI